MNIKKYAHVTLLLFTIPLYTVEKAVICVPIADLLGNPAHTIYPTQSSSDSYNALPVCGEKNGSYSCPRLHQLLYNDIVEVVSKKNDETCIKISQVFYTTPSSPQQSTYWTATKNLRMLDDITKAKIDIQHIPHPIDFQFQKKNLTESNNYPTISLTLPHYDPKTKITFSAGTRFVCTSPQKKLSSKKIKVFAIDHMYNKEVHIHIPTQKCIYFNDSSNPTEQIKQFVQLLKLWANQKNSFIPYVWGGTSFITTTNKPFKEIIKETDGNSYSFYTFDGAQTAPKNGFDCSGLITRAAHICGMPYFYKNTTTIGQYLPALKTTDTLSNGDLILLKGHVMIISDIEKNLLIEARGYNHGYGKVHEIELNNVFDEIETYNDLCKKFFQKNPLKRKDITGTIKDTFNDWKILKII